ncbi:MAG TPA: NAD(P)H-binding protein [Solirubrobacterales bacterium]|jgi:putative NADH-flavin reductase|nr:NAD(P)H-binding protein [Solirubrobacterales bacterium]
MRLAILGATGTVGTQLLAQALDAGHQARVLVRTPSKLGASRSGLTVIEGNVKDKAAVKETLIGCDAVLSTLGASGKDEPDTRRTGTANIIAAMHEAGIRRLVVMGGVHLHSRGDPGNLGQKLLMLILGLSRNLVEDTTAMGALVQASDLDWTLVRSPRVVDGSSVGSYRTGTLKLGPWSKARRADVASFMLRCLIDDSYVRQAPMISR